VRVDKLALTANSISYVIGSEAGLMPWLDLFPAPPGNGRIPCWGFGDVLHSKHADIPEGERLYGFFPITSHVTLVPGKPNERGFTDSASHRAGVAPFYNEYSFIRREPGYAPEFEDMMMLFRPLFGTSFLLESYCQDHDFLNQAGQVIITSASSKTAMGFGHLLQKHHGDRVQAIGLTSKRNRSFVEGLGCYTTVLDYDDIGALDTGTKAVFFDIAGNRDIAASVHQHLGSALIYSGMVGQTHWPDKDSAVEDSLPGPTPVYWSGPDQVMALRERYGEKDFLRRVQSSMIEFMLTAGNWIQIVRAEGPDEIDERVKSMLSGNVCANEGIVLAP